MGSASVGRRTEQEQATEEQRQDQLQRVPAAVRGSQIERCRAHVQDSVN